LLTSLYIDVIYPGRHLSAPSGSSSIYFFLLLKSCPSICSVLSCSYSLFCLDHIVCCKPWSLTGVTALSGDVWFTRRRLVLTSACLWVPGLLASVVHLVLASH